MAHKNITTIVNEVNVGANKEFLLKLYEECMSEMINYQNNAARFFMNFSTVVVVTLGLVETNELQVTLKEKLILTIGVVLLTSFYVILNRIYTSSVYKTSIVIKRLDTIFKSYEHGHYVKDETLLPLEWKHIDRKSFRDPIFRVSLYGFVLLALLALLVIWTI